MLLAGVVAGGSVGAISTARFAGRPEAQLATISITAVSVVFAVGVVAVAVVGFLIGRAGAAGRSDAVAAPSGLVGAALLGAVTLAAAALVSDTFGPANYLWPDVAALGGALVGGAAAVMLRAPSRAVTTGSPARASALPGGRTG
jgi:hypothetical protein